jgi:chorismate synthase
LCIAGGLALQWLARKGIAVGAHIAAIGGIADEAFDPMSVTAAELTAPREKTFPTVSDASGAAMLEIIEQARGEQDSVGGIIECAAVGIPAGWGGELFDGVESTLARLVFSVPGVKGFEIGAGFGAAKLRGSENNDSFRYENGQVKTLTNNHGGLLGGITSGMPLIFRAAVKPTPSIGKKQLTVDLSTGENVELEISGRHDACIVPRALPVMEACMALALLDAMI